MCADRYSGMILAQPLRIKGNDYDRGKISAFLIMSSAMREQRRRFVKFESSH